MGDDATPLAKKVRAAPKTSRRLKNEERIDRMEDKLEELLKLLTPNKNGTTEHLEKRSKSPEPTEKKGSASPSTSKSTSQGEKSSKDKHEHSKSKKNRDDVTPLTPVQQSNDRKTIEAEASKVPDLPKFDGDPMGTPVYKYVHELEYFGKKYDWDEKSFIDAMKRSLKGDALKWFNSQEDKDIPWAQWKKRLDNKYGSREVMFKLQEFVSTFRRADQHLIEFYYVKKRQGEYLRLHDNIICNVIIHRLSDPSLEDGALQADCRDLRSLLDYLKLYNTCTNCGLRGHTSSQCFGFCSRCHRPGHKSEFCKNRKRSASPTMF